MKEVTTHPRSFLTRLISLLVMEAFLCSASLSALASPQPTYSTLRPAASHNSNRGALARELRDPGRARDGGAKEDVQKILDGVQPDGPKKIVDINSRERRGHPKFAFENMPSGRFTLKDYIQKTTVPLSTARRDFDVLKELGLVTIHRPSGGKPHTIELAVPENLKSALLEILEDYRNIRDLPRVKEQILSELKTALVKTKERFIEAGMIKSKKKESKNVVRKEAKLIIGDMVTIDPDFSIPVLSEVLEPEIIKEHTIIKNFKRILNITVIVLPLVTTFRIMTILNRILRIYRWTGPVEKFLLSFYDERSTFYDNDFKRFAVEKLSEMNKEEAYNVLIGFLREYMEAEIGGSRSMTGKLVGGTVRRVMKETTEGAQKRVIFDGVGRLRALMEEAKEVLKRAGKGILTTIVRLVFDEATGEIIIYKTTDALVIKVINILGDNKVTAATEVLRGIETGAKKYKKIKYAARKALGKIEETAENEGLNPPATEEEDDGVAQDGGKRIASHHIPSEVIAQHKNLEAPVIRVFHNRVFLDSFVPATRFLAERRMVQFLGTDQSGVRDVLVLSDPVKGDFFENVSKALSDPRVIEKIGLNVQSLSPSDFALVLNAEQTDAQQIVEELRGKFGDDLSIELIGPKAWGDEMEALLRNFGSVETLKVLAVSDRIPKPDDPTSIAQGFNPTQTLAEYLKGTRGFVEFNVETISVNAQRAYILYRSIATGL